MTKDRWQTILGQLKDNFEVEETGEEHVDDEGGVTIEFVIFKGPLGRMRLEFVSKPAVLDKKTTYSKRIGSETKVDYIYSKDERAETMTAYKWDDGIEEWVEMEASMFE